MYSRKEDGNKQKERTHQMLIEIVATTVNIRAKTPDSRDPLLAESPTFWVVETAPVEVGFTVVVGSTASAPATVALPLTQAVTMY
jgi:hypothetical protein